MQDQLPPDPSEVPQGDVPPDALAVQDAPGPLPSAFITSLVPVIGPPPMFQAPAPPPLPAPTATDPKQHLLAIAALGAMLGLGKQGGAGVGAGLLSAQAHMDADKKQQYNQALLVQQHQQAQAAAQYRQDELIYQRRAQAYLGAIDAIGKHAASGVIPTKAQYDLEIEGYATRLQQGGFRVSANQLRQQAPYIAPTAKKLMAAAVHEWLKNPANKILIEQHPEAFKDVYLPIDRDGDGVPERVPLLQASSIGEVPFSVDRDGAVFEFPKGTTADTKASADGIFEDLLAKADAEKKDTKDPTLRASLRVQAMKMAKEATQGPVDPLAEELKQQRLAEGRRRAEADTEKNAPLDITDNVNTTASGRKYVDVSEFQTAEAREKARQAAQAAGVRAVSKESADSLRAADTARTNLQALLAQVRPYLPKDATGRLVGGPRNTLARIFQSNPVLGAYGSWRTAAIQAVQALAEKGMGLRLNRSEIDLMLDNDIPQITDDGPTAVQRVNNLFTLLDNKERDLLDRDRSVAPATGGGVPRELDQLRNRGAK